MQIPTHVGINGISEIVHRNGVSADYHIGGGTKDHGKDIHHQNAGKIEKIKLKCAHGKLYMPAEAVEEIEEDQNHKGTGAGIVGQHKADKPPYLSPEDQSLVKAQQVIQHSSAVKQTHDVNKRRTQYHIKHQIGNALVPVFVAEPFKFRS